MPRAALGMSHSHVQRDALTASTLTVSCSTMSAIMSIATPATAPSPPFEPGRSSVEAECYACFCRLGDPCLGVRGMARAYALGQRRFS